MSGQLYPTDLTDSQWDLIRDLIPVPSARGRPRELDMRQVVNAVLYIAVTGAQWRMLPREYPCWQSVYGYFRRWRITGVWKRIHDTLRAQERQRIGRHKHPTAGSLDSQSVKASGWPGKRGYDAGKRINGRKRHIVVDTSGLLLAVAVTPASVQDRDGAKHVLARLDGAAKKLRLLWADGGYRGRLLNWVDQRFRFHLSIVPRPRDKPGFQVLPRRWVVERTFGWLMFNRRLVRDYEALPSTSETFIHIAMVRLMLRRLAPT
jgi:putative transposase